MSHEAAAAATAMETVCDKEKKNLKKKKPVSPHTHTRHDYNNYY